VKIDIIFTAGSSHGLVVKMIFTAGLLARAGGENSVYFHRRP